MNAKKILAKTHINIRQIKIICTFKMAKQILKRLKYDELQYADAMTHRPDKVAKRETSITN